MAYHQNVRINLILFSSVSVAWIWWNVSKFGWGCGVQHFLTLTLVFVFFNVCDKPINKIIWFFTILAARILLFSLSRGLTDTTDTGTLYQTLNSISFFLMLAAMCIVFSTSIQSTERQLMLKNQTLYKEAGTDPLTGHVVRRRAKRSVQLI